MKRITSVSALLAVLMAVSAFASCRKPNNSSETTDGKVSTGSNDGDQYQANIYLTRITTVCDKIAYHSGLKVHNA